jgi:hypothetical protein
VLLGVGAAEVEPEAPLEPEAVRLGVVLPGALCEGLALGAVLKVDCASRNCRGR